MKVMNKGRVLSTWAEFKFKVCKIIVNPRGMLLGMIKLVSLKRNNKAKEMIAHLLGSGDLLTAS